VALFAIFGKVQSSAICATGLSWEGTRALLTREHIYAVLSYVKKCF
jgi:hypothetical protein